MNLVKQRILVFLFPLILSLPFLNRAYFVDDNYFVEIAHWLKDNPSQPYHFITDDAAIGNRGWEEDGFVRMVNPLAHHYYLAFLLKIGGEREWFLRLGCVLLSCVSGLFLLGLARRFSSRPVFTTLLVCATPVFWLSSYSLLIDSTMGMFFLGSLYFFIEAKEKEPWPFLILSGVFMGLAILTKYTAVLILPLTGLWWILNWKKYKQPWIFAIPWIIGLLFLLGYSLWTAQIYGTSHILAASSRDITRNWGYGKLTLFVFFSGAILFPLVGWGFFPKKTNIFNGLFVFFLAFLLSSSAGGFSFFQGLLFSLWFFTAFVFVSALVVIYFKKQWEFPNDIFLGGWVFGFFAMMIIVMPWVAVRYFVIVVPAVVFLSVKMVEIRWPTRATQILKESFIALMVISCSMAYADYKQASPSRDLAGRLERDGFEGGERHFYLGDTFTMSYFRGEGWIPSFPETKFKKGDWVLAKEVTMPLVWFFKNPLEVKILAVFDYPTRFPIKVMDFQGSAGFYASVWGALPFTFSPSSWERFHLLEVVSVKENSDEGVTFIKNE